MYNIKTYNKISLSGLSRFPSTKYNVSETVENPEGILLRSHKLHDEPIPSCLLAIARAGAGVNNLPVESYTAKGIVAFNTPGANANAVKELVLTGMLLASRGIISGMQYAQQLVTIDDAAVMHKRLESEKKRFAGSELVGKTLGVVGLGAIGSMVTEMALSLGMKVLGYDPALSIEAAWRLPSQVKKMDDLHSLLASADFVSLHVPAIEPTFHLINNVALKHIKKGSVLLNFARETIVDPDAIVESLDAGCLGQYVCDFPEPCLLGRNDVMAMPHIGASTAEAEENCAIMAVDQLMNFLESGNIKNSVNFPNVTMDRAGVCRLTFTNINVAGVLGEVLSVFTSYQVNVVDMVNRSRGEIAYNIIDLEQLPEEKALADIRSLENVIGLRLILH
jgi:D-3-phosphoglycerate dehydrogenase